MPYTCRCQTSTRPPSARARQTSVVQHAVSKHGDPARTAGTRSGACSPTRFASAMARPLMPTAAAARPRARGARSIDWADLHQAVWEGPRCLSRCFTGTVGRRPVDVFAPVSRDETIGAGQVMPAKVITTGPSSPSSSSTESPTRATRTVLVPLISIETSSQIARSIPVNVRRLTMLPALDNHDAAPPSCHRKVVHNQEPPLPGKGNEGS
jgi:hypothetical protein